MITLQAATKHIAFTWDAHTSLVALADRSKLEQILLNLLTNAVKFTEPGGRVTMRCEADGDRVLAHVEDTGAGIPADRLAMIFEPFVQLGRSCVNHREGAGLGLAISRDLARGMGGDLLVSSRVGVGSTFTVSLRRSSPPGVADSDAPEGRTR